MANPELVEYIRKNLKAFGAASLRERLAADGVAPEEIEAAFTEATKTSARRKSKLSTYAAFGGVLLLILAFLSSGKNDSSPDGGSAEESLFRGHYGYIIKLPPKYGAMQSFPDARKVQEVVHFYPKGTDPSQFIHEGLYGSLGILRLEAAPRRVPQGLIGIDTLRSWVKTKLTSEKATYTLRDQWVHGMPGFVVTVTEPFPSAKAYLVGQKVYYTLTAGSEDALFTDILSSLIEAAPSDQPAQ